jgi:NAD(P)-dependent dehydrogenase (short-subunit alcohol dehydrogenase family)
VEDRQAEELSSRLSFYILSGHFGRISGRRTLVDEEASVVDFFQDKVVLITGAARGIGLATAELLGSRGAKLVVTDVLDDSLQEAEEALRKKGVPVLTARSDVTDPEQCKGIVSRGLERFGTLDVLINNAGISIVAPFEECVPSVARKLVDVNLMGSIYMTLAALDSLKSSQGHVVFVSSVSGIRAIPTGSLYSSSKAALRSLAESLRLEFKPYGIHVGVITPGFTTTDSAKTVYQGDGTLRPIDRPPHDTPEGVAGGIATLVEKRERERVLTPLGKATSIMQRISPRLVDRILQGRELKN